MVGSLYAGTELFAHKLMGIPGAQSTKSLQLTRRSSKSWLGDDEGDSYDPFVDIGDDFSGDADDLQANLIRDKRATLFANINRIIDLLQPSTPSAILIAACDELVGLTEERLILPLTRGCEQLGMLESTSDMGLDSHFVTSHGMLA